MIKQLHRAEPETIACSDRHSVGEQKNALLIKQSICSIKREKHWT